MIIRKLRLEKGWSQEHLSQISGVSTRTIQRIERGGRASLESLKCLAAVFETDFNNLRQDTEMPKDSNFDDNIDGNAPLSNDERAALAKVREWMKYDDSGYNHDPSLSDEERDAMEYVRDIKSFYINFGMYLLTMVVLLVVNVMTSPEYMWVIWPALGWGIGIVSHGLSVFEVFTPFGNDWEKRQIKKRLRQK